MSTTSPADRDDPDVDLILFAYEAFAREDIDAAVRGLHPDVEWIERDEFPGGGRYVGPESVAGYLRASRTMWSELDSQPSPYRRGDKIVVVHRVTGQLTDGSTQTTTVADVYTVEDGLVTRMQAYADPAEAFDDNP